MVVHGGGGAGKLTRTPTSLLRSPTVRTVSFHAFGDPELPVTSRSPRSACAGAATTSRSRRPRSSPRQPSPSSGRRRERGAAAMDATAEGTERGGRGRCDGRRLPRRPGQLRAADSPATAPRTPDRRR
ncbi:hypothetical protein ACP70R_048629 [Stipagrostis hirtigluma subsp. patula]